MNVTLDNDLQCNKFYILMEDDVLVLNLEASPISQNEAPDYIKSSIYILNKKGNTTWLYVINFCCYLSGTSVDVTHVSSIDAKLDPRICAIFHV